MASARIETPTGRLTRGNNRLFRSATWRRQEAAISLFIDLETVRIVQQLSKQGIESVLLKGPVLARLLYSQEEPRGYVDIDLLVPPFEVEAALRLLAGQGYGDILASEIERAPHARTLRRTVPDGTGAVDVDLHTSFHGVGVDPKEFWRAIRGEAETLAISDSEVAVPSTRAVALLVGLHATAGGAARAKPLADLDRALGRLPDSLWGEAFGLAVQLRAEAWFLAGLDLSAEGRALVARCGFSGARSATALLSSRGSPPTALGIQRLFETGGWRNRWRLLARELIPTAEFMRMSSPLAKRGLFGLLSAYALRSLWLAAMLPRGLRAVVALRRDLRRTQ